MAARQAVLAFVSYRPRIVCCARSPRFSRETLDLRSHACRPVFAGARVRGGPGAASRSPQCGSKHDQSVGLSCSVGGHIASLSGRPAAIRSGRLSVWRCCSGNSLRSRHKLLGGAIRIRVATKINPSLRRDRSSIRVGWPSCRERDSGASAMAIHPTRPLICRVVGRRRGSGALATFLADGSHVCDTHDDSFPARASDRESYRDLPFAARREPARGSRTSAGRVRCRLAPVCKRNQAGDGRFVAETRLRLTTHQ